METHMAHNLYERRPITKSNAPAVKWVKQWVPQDLVASGGKCRIMKWVNEATVKAMKEKQEPEVPEPEPEPEPTTEVLFLCSYEGCGKTFFDVGALRKHSNIHGERQFICHYNNCGKKFFDSSKLKRHFLIHTGARDFVCPHEGCGKAFSLDFNLRSHMKTHSQENYHICPFQECGKRFAHEYKLKNHISSHHEKSMPETPKYNIQTIEKPVKTPKQSTVAYASPSIDRPYACPYMGCGKTYIHEYKLNLHLRREHPGHFPDENVKNEEAIQKQSSRGNKVNVKFVAPKVVPSNIQSKQRKIVHVSPSNVNVGKKAWRVPEERFEEEDSEETEEERENVNVVDDEDDDELTEYED